MTPAPVRLYVVREWSDVLSATFTLLRQNWQVFGKALLFFAAPLIGIGAAFLGYFQISIFDLSGSDGSFPFDLGALGAGMLAAAVVNIAGAVLAVSVSMAVVSLHLRLGPGAFTVEEVWREARPLLGRVLGAILLGIVAMIPGAFLLIVPCLGVLALLVLVVYLGVGFSLVFASLSFEDAGVLEGYRRSWHLVEGYWWPTAGVIVLAGLVYYMIAGVLSVPASVLMMITTFNSLESGDVTFSPLYILLLVIASAGSALFYPIPLVAMTLQFGSLVERKERRGLAERVASLQTEMPPSPMPPPLAAPGPAPEG